LGIDLGIINPIIEVDTQIVITLVMEATNGVFHPFNAIYGFKLQDLDNPVNMMNLIGIWKEW